MQKFTGAVVPLDEETQPTGMQKFTGELVPLDTEPVTPSSVISDERPIMGGDQPDYTLTRKPARATLPPQEFPDQVSRAQDVGPGPTSLLDATRNTGAAALKIGGTAVKGAVDIADLLTGDTVDLGVSKSIDDRMKVITQVVGTEQLNDQQRKFARLMADDSKSFGDMVNFLLDNPAVAVDQGVSTIGSMFLPAGAAAGAGKAAKALEWGAKATEKAIVATSITSSALQNAADTFHADELSGASKSDRMLGAVVSGALSAVVGKATGGGAEATVAKRLLGDIQAGVSGAVAAGKNFLKSAGKEILREGAQEGGEELGNVAGEMTGGAQAPTGAGLAKRVGLSAGIGAALGGGAHVATSGPQISQDLAQGRADATAEAALEKARTLFQPAGRAAPAQATTGAPGAQTQPTAPEIPTAQASEAAVQQPGYQPRADEPGIDPLTLQPIKPATPTAGQIAVDPNDIGGSIAKIADAPLPAVDHIGALTVAAVETIKGEQEQATTQAEGNKTLVQDMYQRAQDEERATAKEASLEKVEPIEAAKAILRKNGISDETIAAMPNLAIRQDANTFTKHEQTAKTNAEEKQNASAVRSDAGQVRKGSEKGQPGVQPGAGQGGGNLQQPSPEGTGNGQARGDRQLGAEVKPKVTPEQAAASRLDKRISVVKTTAAMDDATKTRLNVLKSEARALVDRTGGRMTAKEGSRFDAINREIQGIRHDNGKPDTAEHVVATPAERMSTLTPETHAAIQQDLFRNRDIHVAIASAAAGTLDASDTAIDRIFDGKDKTVSPQQMYDNFDGSRAALRAQYGDKITLYRATGQQKSKTTTNWATTREFAAQFGKNVVERTFPIEDVLAAHSSGKGRYHELIMGAPPAQTKAAVTHYTEGESGLVAHKIDAELNTPNRINGSAPRKTVKGSVNDVREVAHLILGKPPAAVVQAPNNGNPRALTVKEHTYIAGMLSDALDAGLDPAALKALEAFHVYTPPDISEWARFQSARGGHDRSIGFSDHLMEGVLSGSKAHQSALLNLFLHEVGHELDTYKGALLTKQSSATAPELEVTRHEETGARLATGSVVKELILYNRAGKNGALREFLDYPMAQWGHARNSDAFTGTLQEEVFAQMNALWFTQRALMKSELPAAYAMMERVHNAIREIDRTGSNADQAANARTAVQRALRSRGPVSEQSPAARADRGGVRGSPREGQAELRVAADRSGSIAERYGNRFDYASRLEGKAAKQAMPDMSHLRGAMTPDEVTKFVTAKTAKTFLRLLGTLPSQEEMAAVAYAGKAKRGWYRDAGQAIHAVFGLDAPRFTAMLAAMSPRTSVEMNLQAALQTWNLWVKAGRPTSHSAIVALLPDGIANTAVLITTAQTNVLRALTHPDPASLVESGPKVQSFFSNLMGNVNEVTNDGWMAAWANFKATLLGGREMPKDTYGRMGGKSPGYIAMSVRAREAAQLLTKLTGETWTPAEVQETVWSWAKTLYEWASVDKSALDIVKNKELTDALIASTPDFASLLQGGVYEQNLRAGGYGPQLDALAAARRERNAGAVGAEGNAGKKAPFAPRTQQKHEEASAARLDALRESRANEGVPGVPQVPGGAVMDDFREDPSAAMQKPGWAMMTAVLDSKSDDENAIRNDQLESWFEKNKVEYHKVTGRYEGKDENSYLIFADGEKAMRAAKQFKQKSIATSDGIEYTNGEVDPWDHSKTLVGPDAVMGDHTVLPDGTAVALQMADKLVTKKALSTRLRPLDNLPGSSPGPSATVHRAAVEYMAKRNLPYEPPTKYVKVDPAYSKRIADAYEAMPHAPDDPAVKVAYEALIAETRAQWDAMMATGLKVDFTSAENPYPYTSPMDTVRDIRDNNHLTVFSTDDGFGTDATFDPATNPLLATTDVVVDGKTLLANDLFRAVHDFYGHAKDGVGFRADGEENAWRAHAAMFSTNARKAMTTETRGQNSWLNYGPHGETNRTAKTEDTKFADQKTGLLPDEFTIDRYEDRGRVDTAKAGNVMVESINDDGSTVRVEKTAKQAIDDNAALKDKMDKVIGCLGK